MSHYGKTNYITLRIVHISEKYPKGAFEAVIKRKGFGNKSKQASVNVYEPEEAFEIVDLFAEDKAKEFNLPYEKVSLNRLNEILAAGSQRSSTQQKEGHIKRASTLKEKPSLGHIGYFKSDIRRAFEVESFDKIKQVLAEGLALLEELEAERIRVSKNSHGAKVAVAKVMYETFRDTGVDTSVYCNDSEILTQFNRFKEEGRQSALI